MERLACVHAYLSAPHPRCFHRMHCSAFPELQGLPVELVRGRTLLVADDEAAPLPAVSTNSLTF